MNLCFDLFLKQSKQNSYRSQRIVSVMTIKYKTALQNLISNDLFYYASKLVYFVDDNPDTTILLFHNAMRIQIRWSLQSFIEQCDDFSTADFSIMPHTTNSKQRQHILVVKTEFVPTLQHFILCEWVSDSSSIRKNAMLISPFLSSLFFQNDVTVFSTIKTILRWFCISRTQYRGLLQPGEPGFKLYQYLPKLLACFSTRRELSKYHTRKFVSPSSKRIDNTVPNFLRGLKSFLQLKHEHYIDLKSIQSIHNYIHSRKYLQSVFPQVWDITNHVLFNTNKKNKVSLNDVFVMDGHNYPSFLFVYALMLHKNVPKKIKQMIWLNTYTTTQMVLPSKLKGIEHMHRHHTIYKSYEDFVSDSGEPNTHDTNEFLQLMVFLEYRSYMNPSKLSFKISNIPTIKFKTKPVAFPIMTKTKTKTSIEFDRRNYIYSNNSWVIRNVELPPDFRFKREFLIDQMMISSL